MESCRGIKINNSGVSVRGNSSAGKCDWYGKLKEIIELEYANEPIKRVVLFKCEWFDPTRPTGTCKHNQYNIIEINHTKRYRDFNSFIIAQNVRQAYFLSYPRKCNKS